MTSATARDLERARAVKSLAAIRWAGTVFAFVQVFAFYLPYPGRTLAAALLVAATLLVGNMIIWWMLSRSTPEVAARLALPSLALDTAAISAFVFIYAFDPQTSIWAVLYILPLEGALLFQRRGALVVMGVAATAYICREVYAYVEYDYEIFPFSISFRLGIGFLIATVAGASTQNLVREKDRVAQTQEALRDTNQQLSTVLANLPGMAYRCLNDEAWTMEFVSEGVSELTGYGSHDFLTKKVTYGSLIHPADSERVWHEVQEALAAGEVFQLEYRMITRSGGEKWVWEQGRQVEADGRAMLEGLVVDASERKHLEAAFAQAQRMDAVGRLAGGIAHDFNNILSVIMNYADFVSEDLQERLASSDTTGLQEDVAEIRLAAGRGASMISQLLAFSRKDPAKPECLSLSRCIREFEVLLRRAIREDVELQFELNDEGCVFIDRSQLEQILLNLIVNSGDAIVGGGVVTISTGAACVDTDHAALHPGMKEGSYITMSVRDTGTGIEPTILKHIFEPFFTTKPRESGTGLGLASVYGIVKGLDGYVAVDSHLGSGTTFTIYLPAAEEETVPIRRDHPAPDRAPLRGAVLVVEDEPGVRTSTERVLRRAGLEVAVAAEANAAMAIARSRRFDVLITDVVMPGPSGPALVDALRAEALLPRHVLYMTGYDDGLVPNASSDVPVLRKPFSGDQLLETLHALRAHIEVTDA